MCRCRNTREWNLGQLWYLKREKSHTAKVKWRVARERVRECHWVFMGVREKRTYKPKLKENGFLLLSACMVRCWAVTALMDPVLSTQFGIISPWTATSFMALWLPRGLQWRLRQTHRPSSLTQGPWSSHHTISPSQWHIRMYKTHVNTSS